MASVLLVLNDGPYGSERFCSAFPHAMAVTRQEEAEATVGVFCRPTT
jgi:sulfur relay (sulfurtransferase) complex TusBCD TusD component (DsrE family)